MRTYLALVLYLLLGSLACAQFERTAETVYIVEGETPTGDYYTSPPTVRMAGLVVINEVYDSVSLLAETEDLTPVEVRRVSEEGWALLGTGRIRVILTTANKEPFAVNTERFIVTVSGTDTLPPPDPQPPEPIEPPIAGEGLKVLIVYEIDDMPKYPPEQANAIFSADLRKWFRDNCSKEGGATEARVLDKDAVKGQDQRWIDALGRERSSLPWIVISNGAKSYEGPLPGNLTDIIALLEEHK